MSSHGLTRMAKRMLDRLEKAGVRDDVQKHVGQIFVWKREEFETAMRDHTSEANVRKLVKVWQTKLAAADAKMMRSPQKNRLRKAKESIKALRIEKFNPTTDELYAVYNYMTVRSIKRDVGHEFHKLTGKDSAAVTGRIDSGQAAAQASGTHIGHGEFGHAVSTTKALAAEAAMKTKTMQRKYSSDPAYKKLEEHLVTYKEMLDIDLNVEHYQELTARGKLSKRYTAILSSQGAGANMLEALSENEALAMLKASVEADYKDLLHTKGSDSLFEAIESVVVLGNLTKSKRVKSKKGAKPKQKSKSKGKSAQQKGKTASNSRMKVSSGAGAIAPKYKSSRARRGSSSSPLRLLALINKELPSTVRKNMDLPALQNRTGRFAESVKLTDISQTPQGFPSIGYTYQRDPYQVFETGSKGNWSSPERDPRSLIDKSIREIAAQYALGRFYTRRM